MKVLLDSCSVINLVHAGALELVCSLNGIEWWLTPLVVDESGPTCAAVMLDLTMPNGASEEITNIMASQHATHPIIFLTGRPPEEIEHRRKQAEAQGLKIAAILHKPFWIEDIASAMSIAMAMP